MYSFPSAFHVIEYVFVSPTTSLVISSYFTSVIVPVVSKPTVSPLTRPSYVPSAVNGVPSYGLEAEGVVIVNLAGLIKISPS